MSGMWEIRLMAMDTWDNPRETSPKSGEQIVDEALKVDVDGKKYTVVIPKDGGTHILRYGEDWIGPHFAGVNAVSAMAHELHDLRTWAVAAKQTLQETAEQFRTYAVHHAGKGAEEKAKTNTVWAEKCLAAAEMPET